MPEGHEPQPLNQTPLSKPTTKSVLRPVTALAAGLVAAGVLMVIVTIHPWRVHGSTPWARLHWEQRQQMVDNAVTSQQRGESSGTTPDE